jgi:hypothetical protein
MVKMALVEWVNPVKFFRETSRTGPRHSRGNLEMYFRAEPTELGVSITHHPFYFAVS